MARPRTHLRHAPIAEAIIDFRVSRPHPVEAEVFSELQGSVGAPYDRKSPVRLVQGYFGIDNGRVVNPAQTQIELGWRYQSAHEVAQFRTDGFTFSKLEPYTSWTEVFGEAFRLWTVYRGVADPAHVSRLAVRYINRMRLPSAPGVGHYLEAPPVLPPPIPQNVREFLARVYVDDHDLNASAAIVQALEPPEDATMLSILLDIDAFSQVNLAPDDPRLPNIFEGLRGLKNRIFYATITEPTVERYE
jgi:uncharacterized protein (TIGR04255 family)